MRPLSRSKHVPGISNKGKVPGISAGGKVPGISNGKIPGMGKPDPKLFGKEQLEKLVK